MRLFLLIIWGLIIITVFPVTGNTGIISVFGDGRNFGSLYDNKDDSGILIIDGFEAYIELEKNMTIGRINLIWKSITEKPEIELFGGMSLFNIRRININDVIYKNKQSEILFEKIKVKILKVRFSGIKNSKNELSEITIPEQEINLSNFNLEIYSEKVSGSSFQVKIKGNMSFSCSLIVNESDGGDEKILNSTSFSETHVFKVDGLKSGTSYLYRVRYNYNDYIAYSQVKKIKTYGQKPFKIKNINVVPQNGYSIINISASASFMYLIKYGEQKNILSFEDQSHGFVKQGEIIIDSIGPGKDVYAEIDITDQMGRNRIKKTLKFTQPDRNVAFLKKVNGTFNVGYYDKNIDKLNLGKVTDGNKECNDGMALSSDISRNDQNVIIDLGQEIILKKVVTTWWKLAYSKNYDISVSKDKLKWQKVVSAVNADTGIHKRSPDGNPIIVVNNEIDNIIGRYVQLICKKRKYFSKHFNWNYIALIEVEVY